MQRRWWRLIAVFVGALALAGCKKSDNAGQQTDDKAVDQTGTAPASDGAPAALSPKRDKKSRMPPEARRNSPPDQIADTALAVGTSAPSLERVPSTTGAWTRPADAVSVLVFYRGDW